MLGVCTNKPVMALLLDLLDPDDIINFFVFLTLVDKDKAKPMSSIFRNTDFWSGMYLKVPMETQHEKDIRSYEIRAALNIKQEASASNVLIARTLDHKLSKLKVFCLPITDTLSHEFVTISKDDIMLRGQLITKSDVNAPCTNYIILHHDNENVSIVQVYDYAQCPKSGNFEYGRYKRKDIQKKKFDLRFIRRWFYSMYMI